MDLNELLHAHQVAVMQASAKGDGPGRDNHFAKVAEYAERVRQLRELNQMSVTPTPAQKPETIIYGSYAGEAAVAAPAEPVADWEGEGGALRKPELAVPDGVRVETVRQYHVGGYVYQDLALAVAEHTRQQARAAGD